MAVNRRIQYLVEQHVQVLAREIAEELARPLLDQFAGKLTNGSGLSMEAHVHTEPLPGEIPLFLPRLRKWLCPRCNKFSDFQRRAVSTHLRFCRPDNMSASEPNPLACPKCREEFETKAERDGHLRWCGKDPKKTLPRVCLKPGCKKLNRGPRFRYLCKIHERASEKQVEKWRKERAERNGL
jgi:hypothetical protein